MIQIIQIVQQLVSVGGDFNKPLCKLWNRPPKQPAPDSVFSKLPPEQQQEMTDSVKAMLQILIDADVKSTGEVTQGTLDAIQTQGFVLSGDGTLQRAEAQPEPQPWNGIDGLLNNKPIMPEAPPRNGPTPDRLAERNGQRRATRNAG